MIWCKDGRKFKLILNAGHNEYTIPRARVVWDPYDEVAEIDLDEVLKRGSNVYLWYDDDLRGWGSLIELTGSRSDLEQDFNEYADGFPERPSGDDDSFDYWPSGMRMLWEFAIDLAVMFEQRRPEFINRYYQVLDRALEAEYSVDQLDLVADEWSHVPLAQERTIKLLLDKLKEDQE